MNFTLFDSTISFSSETCFEVFCIIASGQFGLALLVNVFYIKIVLDEMTNISIESTWIEGVGYNSQMATTI